jgi:nuclear transcription factor Y gamma
MISQEAPVLFAKACEIFVKELTLRAWLHTEENKRKTLQRNDIAAAVSKTDPFDFLIDIVPRDDIKASAKKADDGRNVPAELQQYYYQLAQQQAMAQQQHLQQQQQQQQQQHHQPHHQPQHQPPMQHQQVHQQPHQQPMQHVADPAALQPGRQAGQAIIDPYSFQLMYQQHQYRYLQQAHLMQTMQQVQPDDAFHPGERHQDDY